MLDLMERLKRYVICPRSTCRPSFISLGLVLGSPDGLEMFIDEMNLRTSRWCISLNLKLSSSSSGNNGGGGYLLWGWRFWSIGCTVLFFGGGRPMSVK